MTLTFQTDNIKLGSTGLERATVVGLAGLCKNGQCQSLAHNSLTFSPVYVR